MIVVADTTPLNYLILIGEIELLSALRVDLHPPLQRRSEEFSHAL
jgi:predicted nucleic acid-binding protein